MSKDIILEPFGGLANRMRVIASGLWLGDKLHKNIKLIWNLSPELNCPFESLFEPINNIEIVNKKFRYRYFRSVEYNNSIRQISRMTTKAILTSNYNVFEDNNVKRIQAGEIDIIKIGNAFKKLYFITCEEFGNNFEKFKLFIPKPEIQKRINEYSDQFNGKTIGVHIRSTDHAIAMEQSPTILFANRILNDLEQDPAANFFLSTDDPEIEFQLKTRFSHKIITIEKEYSRNSHDGIKDALVDFYCLANTQKIYGSYWSSFSDMAARINGINVEKLRIDEKS